MNKLKKGKMEKGITLIALIITIIVLLILAIVTIGAIKNDGLIQYAQNARKDYTDAANKEQEDLNTLLGQIEGNAPGNNGETTGKWTQDGLTVTNGTKTLTVGDTVNYTPGEGSTYTGAWKVLGAENGELLIMTDGYVTDNFALDGSTEWDTETKSYKAQIEALHAECANKVKIEGTKATKVRSIKVEDINRVTGYDPTNQKDGTVFGAGEAYQYGNTVRYYLNSGKVAYESKAPDGTVTESESTSDYSKFQHPDKRMLIAEGGTADTGYTGVTEIEVTSDYYYYYASQYLEYNSNAFKLLFGNWEKYYWLASPHTEANTGYAYFGVTFVTDGMVNCHSNMWDSSGGASVCGRAVCAVVSLSSDFQV